MVLLVLAGIWAAVLVSMLRDRSGGRPADSIGTFRHQLRVLQRAGPSVLGSASLRAPAFAPSARPASGAARPRTAEQARRDRTLRRRRDVLAVLLAGMAGTLLLGGLFSSFRVLLALHVVLDLVCVGYVAMLVRARNALAERDMKLRFLPSTQPDNVIMLRRSAN